MKKYYFISIILSVFILAACSKNNDGADIASVSNVTTEPFIGSVTLTFKAPSTDNYYYTLVTYQNSKGETAHKKVSRFDVDSSTGLTSTVIGGFTDTNEHQFVLSACSYDGHSSSEVSVKGTPEGISTAKDYVMGTVSVVPAEGAALITWTNKSGVAVNLLVTYKDKNDNLKTVTFNAQSSGSSAIDIVKTTDITIAAQNVDDQSKSSEKTWTIIPKINPDDMIYDGVDYLTLNTGGLNQINLSQDNPDNLYEYTIVTTGGDPYIPSFGLKAAKVGNVLKFRYKATQMFTLELFWCNKGGGPAGGRSTTVDVPAADTWTTFTHDYTDAMSTYNWAGNAGDFLRMDWGSNSGVTIHVRNIHFEK